MVFKQQGISIYIYRYNNHFIINHHFKWPFPNSYSHSHYYYPFSPQSSSRSYPNGRAAWWCTLLETSSQSKYFWGCLSCLATDRKKTTSLPSVTQKRSRLNPRLLVMATSISSTIWRRVWLWIFRCDIRSVHAVEH